MPTTDALDAQPRPSVDLVHLHGQRRTLNSVAAGWAGSRDLPTVLDGRVAPEAMVKRGRRFIEERLAFDKVAARHRDLYGEVVAEAALGRAGSPAR